MDHLALRLPSRFLFNGWNWEILPSCSWLPGQLLLYFVSHSYFTLIDTQNAHSSRSHSTIATWHTVYLRYQTMAFWINSRWSPSACSIFRLMSKWNGVFAGFQSTSKFMWLYMHAACCTGKIELVNPLDTFPINNYKLLSFCGAALLLIAISGNQ